MNLFGLLDISGSALKAERVRAEVVAANMANSETTRTADGSAYKRHHVLFQSQDGSGFGASLLGQGGLTAGLLPLATKNFGAASATPALLGNGVNTPGGVNVTGVIEDGSDPLRRFDPGHPDADADGYVSYPDINPLTEMVDLMGATRSYGLNVSAVQAEKGMLSASLDLLK
jgi:flagellar basal-body rod protein FlgC